MGEIPYRIFPLGLKITSFVYIELVQAVLIAQSHIGVYIFHTLIPGLLKFNTRNIHKNRYEILPDCSF